MMKLIISDTLYQMKFYHKMLLPLYLIAASLLFFLFFNVFGLLHNCLAKIIIQITIHCMVRCDSGQESESAEFY